MSIRCGVSTLAKLAVILSLPFISLQALACTAPEAVQIPDGTVASEREMVAADTAIKKYISRMERYANCLEGETRKDRSAGTRQDVASVRSREETAARAQNEAAAAIEAVAAGFNQAIEIYMARAK